MKSGFKIFTIDYINSFSQKKRIDFLFNLIKDGNVVIINGRLNPSDELEITNKSLERIDKNFSGIEIASLITDRKKEEKLLDRIKTKITNFLIKDKLGLTLIGPSKKIKEIKQNPSILEIDLK